MRDGRETLKLYFDYKSPYAYLAQAETYRLDEELGVQWRPYTLDIPKFLGAAKLDASGHDTLGERNDHQWRRVRYAYMDCRRQANDRGLVACLLNLYDTEEGPSRPRGIASRGELIPRIRAGVAALD